MAEQKMIYLVKSYGNWDGSFCNVIAFRNYEDAKKEFDTRTATYIDLYKENYDNDDTLVIDKYDCVCEIYLNGFYDDYNHCVSIEQIEIN